MEKTKFTTEELIEIREYISQYQDIEELKNALDITISRRKKAEKKKLNIRFSIDFMKELQILDPIQYKIMKKNNISNLQELLKCNLSKLEGIDSSIERDLDWIRHFYDMSSLDKKKRK